MSGEQGKAGNGGRSKERIEAGEWVQPDVSYIDPVRRFCAYCGRPIARRYWEQRGGRYGEVYCNTAHAAAQATYPSRTD